MPNKILVATPHPAFGELLRISLEENGPYQVRLVGSGTEAQASAARASFAMAILDADLSDPEMPDVARNLQSRSPELRLMVIPLENNGEPIEIDGVRVDGKVNRPYYLPELLQDVQTLLAPVRVELPQLEDFSLQVPDFHQQPPANLPWQHDALTATEQLKALLTEISADSLVILRLRTLYAHAGRLDAAGAQQIAAELARYWDGSQKSDLVRFLSHESPEQDSLLYATALADEFLLAMVYDIPIPLTRCRAQSGKLVRLLMTAPAEEEIIPPLEIETPAQPAVVHSEDSPPIAQVASYVQYDTAPLDLAQAVEAPSVEQPSPGFPPRDAPLPPFEDLEEETTITDDDEDAMAASLAALLSGMPMPDPVLQQPAPGEVIYLGAPAVQDFRFPWEAGEIQSEAVAAAPASEPTPEVEAPLAEPDDSQPVWLTAGGQPVSPFSQPVVEEVWLGSSPEGEAINPDVHTPDVPPAPVLPLPISPMDGSIFPEPTAPPLEVPLPAFLDVDSRPLNAAEPRHDPPQTKPLPAWLDVETQPLAEAELPLEPPQAEPLPAWLNVETQPLNEAELPLTPPQDKPLPAWLEVETQPLTAAELPLELPAKPRPAWEVVDTQPLKVKRPVAKPEPYLGETRRVHTLPPAGVSGPESDNFLAETRPRRASRRAAQEPPTASLDASPARCNGSQPGASTRACTCLLIPLVPEHYLVGGMADLLKQALVKVAAQNHWKVSQVLVRPQYLQWTTETGTDLLPDKVAETVRKRLSVEILKHYPALKKQNRSANFWAEEYLAMQGSEPIPAQRLRTFTRQARANLEVPAEN